MKKILGSLAIAALAMVGCSDDNELLLNNGTLEVFSGEIDVTESRTSLGEGGKVIWSEGDAINLFKKTGYYQKYVVENGGSTSANFKYDNVNITGSKLDQHYAVYPYAETNTIEGSTINMDLSMLANQNYTEGSFAPNMSVMAAKSNTTELSFSNALSIARINLSIDGPVIDAVVKSVKLTSTGASLTGKATIDMSKTKQPAVITGDGKEITLTVADVKLSKEPLPFYIVLPAGVYEKNTLTLTVLAEVNGESQVCNIELPKVQFNRSEIRTLSKCFNNDGEWSGSIGDEALEIIGYKKVDETNYEVYNANGMKWFYDQLIAKNTFSGVTIKLTKDIDMTGVEWVSKTEDAYTNFAGILDGNNTTITNFTATSTATGGYATMFNLFSGEVKNLTLDGVSTTDTDKAGRASALVGYMSGGKLSGVTVKNAIIIGFQKVAGLVSHPADGDIVIENCHVENTTLKDNDTNDEPLWQAGGLVGYALNYKSLTVTGCSVKNITIENAAGESDCGGNPYYCHPFIGNIDYAKDTDATVTLSNNTVEGTNTTTEVCEDCSSEYYGYGKHRKTGKLTITIDGEQAWPVVAATVNGTNYETLEAALDAVKTTGGKIDIKAGTYTFPASKMAAGVTLVCEEGTIFEDTSKGNINGATVIGATFSNPSGTAMDQTINGTFKDCTFEGTNGLRWCYAGETAVFENCVFSGSLYGAHFDGGANDVTFRGCTFSGFNTFGNKITQLTLENCTFKPNGKGDYNGVNMHGNTKMTNCEFIFDGSVTYEWVDISKPNTTCEFQSCTINGQPLKKNDVGGYTENGYSTLIINEENYICVEKMAGLKAAIAELNEVTLLLTDGTYEGEVDLTGKTLNIEASNKNNAIIEGLIWADNCTVTLKGLKLTNPKGVQHPNPQNSQYYTTINNQYPLIGAYTNAAITVDECTLDLTGPTVYGYYGYALDTPVFKNSVFNCNKIRPIANNGDAITVTGCTFNNQYHYSVRIFENSGNRQTVVFTNNTIQGNNDKNEFEGINISKKGNTATIYGDFTIKGNTSDLKYRHHKNNTMDSSCTYATDITNFAFEKEN